MKTKKNKLISDAEDYIEDCRRELEKIKSEYNAEKKTSTAIVWIGYGMVIVGALAVIPGTLAAAIISLILMILGLIIELIGVVKLSKNNEKAVGKLRSFKHRIIALENKNVIRKNEKLTIKVKQVEQELDETIEDIKGGYEAK